MRLAVFHGSHDAVIIISFGIFSCGNGIVRIFRISDFGTVISGVSGYRLIPLIAERAAFRRFRGDAEYVFIFILIIRIAVYQFQILRLSGNERVIIPFCRILFISHGPRRDDHFPRGFIRVCNVPAGKDIAFPLRIRRQGDGQIIGGINAAAGLGVVVTIIIIGSTPKTVLIYVLQRDGLRKFIGPGSRHG